MLHDLILAGLIPALALIHRIRGGLIDTGGKSTYWIWIFVALLDYAAEGDWKRALAWGLGYLIWTLPGWMDEIDLALGIKPDGQVVSHSWDVSVIEAMSLGNPILGCFLRAGVFLIPLGIALFFLGVPVWPLLIVVVMFYPAYVAGWFTDPTNPAMLAEAMVGGSFGAAMLLTKVS